jgi:peptidoglycan hydrolase-like protein with peptidoglycan-binding domain
MWELNFSIAMNVLPARLVFLAFIGLTGCIIYNALYLQDLRGLPVAGSSRPRPVVTTSVSPPADAAKLPPVSTDLPPLNVEQGASDLVLRAVQRELATRGFDVGPIDGKPSDKTRAAILAYQKNQGLPITGVASDELLRHILLGASLPSASATGSVKAVASGAAKPKPVTAESATSKQPTASTASSKVDATIKGVQQTLANLGYAPGRVDGAMGDATTRAITAFQRDRKMAQTGRITPELLRELKRITGQDLTKTAAER